MDLSVQKRLAAQLLKCGEGRVWIDGKSASEVSMAITRDDVRKLINSGKIKKKPEVGISRHRARERHEKRKKGRMSGFGSRKGKSTARYPRKRRWINTIRPLRRALNDLRESKNIDKISYRKLYRMAKGGAFRSVSYMNTYIKERGLMSEKRKR
ncbi:MAG: 50S ribosomal protein L19e [Candidatus Methanofastidiosa archaeon]|jgi:large subunit ribosomal protein L19e|nr:50S ribosomal protein L19e [Candidatus Methanofastidiosa archaeon]HOM95909.1 50S ribosomal protein L19e [Methanofastidiosum sp.]HRS26214.1 50S ribosomal protein L19e [Methanofastidiosum sp.]